MHFLHAETYEMK